MSNGRITEVGSYNELIEQNGTFAELLHNYGTTKVNEDGDEEKRYSSSTDFQGDEKTVAIEAKEDEEHKKKSSFLTGEEKVKSGNIRLSVLNSYIKSCTYYISLLITFFYMLSSGAAVSQNVWLAHWSNTQDNNNNDNDSFNNDDLALNLGVYGLFGVLQAAAVLGFSFSLAIGSLKASVKLHDGMLSNILRSPMSFFDTTPLGRILNRFSKVKKRASTVYDGFILYNYKD
ncbi:PREDICTED: multidrug resistance-associated protein 1-like [Amphimedon queenslandica]|nr:PREDICTED: multidrug resistance-associated protein 1-like [Amphimedon queenslandica]|eukprot:XP_003391152.3 PREDICTED: multidrug resistance-associated protein 1-like [Amphimedon queenslandica]